MADDWVERGYAVKIPPGNISLYMDFSPASAITERRYAGNWGMLRAAPIAATRIDPPQLRAEHNERSEFLGDSVLGCIVANIFILPTRN
jgi:hypothetical protein